MMEQDRVGQKLGNYLLLSILGTGGFATVYLGEHIFFKTKTQAAIKVLKTLELTDKARDKFLKEARTIARLTHPHIIRVIECGVDVGATSSTPYIVMSYATRGNVRNDYPQGTILPFDVIQSYVNQAAEALQYAHDRGTVHCDVKPENMLIGGPNEILLGDFGIANISHTADISAAQNSIFSDPTTSGDIQGTVTYMAPERFQGLIRRSSDQYSLGIVVYEWLTGDPPFTGSRDRVIFQHLTAPPPSIRSKNPHVSPEIEQVVLKALAKEPDQRYATVREFAVALEQAILTLPSYVPTRPATQPLPKQDLSSLPTVANPPDPVIAAPAQSLQPVGPQPASAQTLEDLATSSSSSTKTVQSPSSQSIISPSSGAGSVAPVQPLSSPGTGPAEAPTTVQPPASASSSASQQASFQIPPVPASPFIPRQANLQEPSASASSSASQQASFQIPPVPANPSTFGQANFQNPFEPMVYPDPQQQQDDAAGLKARRGGSHFTQGNNGGPQQATMFNQSPAGGMQPPPSELDEEETAKPLFNLTAVLKNIFALEPEFARLQELRTFRRFGWLANVLCTIAFGVVARSLTAFLLGILTLGAFWLCIRLVKRFLAVLIGLAIAAYWAGFGLYLTKWLMAFPAFSSLPPPEIIGIAFFIMSAVLHIYYIIHRLP